MVQYQPGYRGLTVTGYRLRMLTRNLDSISWGSFSPKILSSEQHAIGNFLLRCKLVRCESNEPKWLPICLVISTIALTDSAAYEAIVDLDCTCFLSACLSLTFAALIFQRNINISQVDADSFSIKLA